MGGVWWRVHEVMTPQRWADVGTLLFMVYLILTWDKRSAKNRQAKADWQETKAALDAKYERDGRDRPWPFRR